MENKNNQSSIIMDTECLSLLAINFAFQKTMNWGGITWKLTENDLCKIRDLIVLENEHKTGKNLWLWFYKKQNKQFVTWRTMKDIGSEFIKHLNRYYS